MMPECKQVFRNLSKFKEGLYIMKRYVYTLELREESVDEYVKYHQDVSKEVEADLTAAGVYNMEIYLLGNRLFSIIEASDGFDPENSLRNYATCQRTTEWNALMATFQVAVKEAKPHELWARMDCVYKKKI